MKEVTIYTWQGCPFCKKAKELLDSKGVNYAEIDMTSQPDFRDKMEKLTGRRTLPQIIIGTTPVGGYSDIKELDDLGRLDELLT